MVYLDIDEGGYLRSVFSRQISEDEPELSLPHLDSLDGLDLSGRRIFAYYWDGEKLVLDEDKLSELEKDQRQEDAKHEQMIRKESARMEITDAVLTATINTVPVDDATALRWIDFYPEWSSSNTYVTGFKVNYNDRLWRCIQAHTSQIGWEPVNTPSLWEEICESHSGTIDDPIPYNNNMTLESDKYYTQFGVTYRCIRDTGVPVYNNLSDLVGLYVEIV